MLFLGCSEKDKEEKNQTSKNIAVADQIEVVENKEYEEYKDLNLDNGGIIEGAKGDAFYYAYGQEVKIKKDIKPEKRYSVLDANIRIRTPYDNVGISMMVKKLSKNFIVKCSACHNDYANGIIGPSLIGKSRDYIYNSIMDFRTDKKSNVLMNELTKMMSAGEIAEIAQEIAIFNEKIKKLKENK